MRPALVMLLAGSAAVMPSPALAQPVDLATVQDQLAAMQAEIARLTAQVAELQAREQARETAPVPVPAPPSAPTAAPAASSATIAWKGAPEISGGGGWSFKPRGRLQLDSAVVDAPDLPGNSLGTATEFRRAFIGFDGTLPGGFGYRVEADLANSSVELTEGPCR